MLAVTCDVQLVSCGIDIASKSVNSASAVHLRLTLLLTKSFGSFHASFLPVGRVELLYLTYY